MQIIQITGTPEEIAAGLQKLLDQHTVKTASELKEEPKDDRTNVDGVIELTGLSKSQIYKMTMLKQIPHNKFTRYLVFSRKEILEWIEELTVTIEPGNKKAARELAKLAMKRDNNG